ncbi:MAG TPA: ATP-binding protein [Solirubrobacteraceae bacterium]|nr:ATP-binding protein [Solirubrobacteraceae bacterium]
MKSASIGNHNRVPGSTTTTTNDVVVALRPQPAAVGAARRVLVSEGLDDDLQHTVCLLTSEIVTNSIRHATFKESDRIVLAARISSEFVRVEVRDPGPGFEPDERHRAPGYGLRMLDMLASRWAVDRDGHGCRVWFEVDRRRRRFDRG